MTNITWDLEKIYQNSKSFYEDIDLLEIKIIDFSKTNRLFYKSADTLLSTIKSYYDVYRLLEKIYVYAKMKKDENGHNDEAIKMYMSAQNINEKFLLATDFYSISLKKLNKKMLDNYLKQNKELKEYEHELKEILRTKKHVLDEKSEKLLSKSSIIRSSYERIFEAIDYNECEFANVGNEVLNHSTYSRFLDNKKQDIRKEAFTNYHKYYEKRSDSLANSLINNMRNDNFIADVRGYKSALNAALDSDLISEKTYHELIKSVKDNIDLLHRYLKIKKNNNNLAEMHMYDVYFYSSKFNKEYTFDEAAKIVTASVAPLGEEYQNIYRSAFKDRWIDPFYHEGKYSGAYSFGTYDTYPYILMNFDGKLKDIETLAHEMGHSMHSYYSKKNNPYHNAGYPIFLAEIASNVSELLLFDYMLKNSTDNEEKKYILELILNSFKGSVFRQIHFAEFETIIHEKLQNNESLTKKDITDIYYDLNKFYYGDEVINDDLIRYECLRVPHFYSSFYVFQYATGLCLAYVFANGIINNEKDGVENYLKFISSGSRDYPINILKDCGVIFDSKIIRKSMKIFENYLNEYEKLIEGDKYGKQKRLL